MDCFVYSSSTIHIIEMSPLSHASYKYYNKWVSFLFVTILDSDERCVPAAASSILEQSHTFLPYSPAMIIPSALSFLSHKLSVYQFRLVQQACWCPFCKHCVDLTIKYYCHQSWIANVSSMDVQVGYTQSSFLGCSNIS